MELVPFEAPLDQLILCLNRTCQICREATHQLLFFFPLQAIYYSLKFHSYGTTRLEMVISLRPQLKPVWVIVFEIEITSFINNGSQVGDKPFVHQLTQLPSISFLPYPGG